MSHLALARKWRPQKFEDVIGQRGVVETLKNAITSGRLAQAFIFAGPRGVGKTTTARILARALNCVNGPTGDPCGVCDACVEIAEGRDLDVFEIDGATYNGVEAVREVIVEPLAMAPMRDRYKIFIIDEVHRLSRQAFDALLKSIEEPPAYVKFMLATTELQMVPATIQSRSQIFELKTLPFMAIREQLRRVTSSEGVQIDDAALALVARSAEGSMRDALSALDQVLAFTADRVTSTDVSTVLGLIGRDAQFEIAETIVREDVAAMFDLAGAIVESGFDPRIVFRELSRLSRDLMVIKVDPTRLSDPEIAAEGERDRLKALSAAFSREDLMRAFDLLSRAEFEIRSSSQPRHYFEMAMVKWIHLRKLTPLTDLIAGFEGGAPAARPQPVTVRSPAPISSPALVPAATVAGAPAFPSRPAARPQATNPGTPEPQNPRIPEPDLKAALLAAIREGNKTFFGVVIAAAQTIEIEGDAMVFTFAAVHKGLRSQLEGKRGWIEQLAMSSAGRRLNVITRESTPAPVPESAATVRAGAQKTDLKARAQAEPSVQAVLDVFGGEIEDVEET
jgi:DNA polymerase III subunit gamma/tau